MINTGAISISPVFAYSFLHHKHTCALTKNRNKPNRQYEYPAPAVSCHEEP